MNASTTLPHAGDARTMNILSATSAWEADGAQEVGGALGIEDSIGVIEGRWLCWWATMRTHAGDGLLCLAQ